MIAELALDGGDAEAMAVLPAAIDHWIAQLLVAQG